MSEQQALYLEVAELAARAVEDELDDVGRARLAELLRESSDAREIYREVMFCISTLTWDWGPQDESLLAEAILGQAIARPESRVESRVDKRKGDLLVELAELEARGEAMPVDLTDELARRKKGTLPTRGIRVSDADAKLSQRVLVIPRFAMYSAIAACLLLGSWLVWIALQHNSTANTAPVADAPASAAPGDSPVPLESDILASLVRTHRAAWSGATAPRIGEGLNSGVLHLTEGYAELRMQRGAAVLIQAPARLELINDNTINLINGSVVAQVPPSAKYFTVQTPTATIVDFGTNFGVTTSEQKGTVAAVFEGEIEVRGITPVEDERVSLRLTAGQAAEVDATGQLNTEFRSLLSEDRLAFVPSWEVAERGWRASGQIQEPVAERLSLSPGHWESDEHMLLIAERKSVALSRELLVREPRGEINDQVPQRRLEAGTAVDSYCFHFDAIGQRDAQDPLFLEAEVRFDRPILGVIYGYYQYLETAEMLGSPNVLYPETIELLGIEPGEDYIEISDDGMTLKLRLGVSNGVDQLRVLVGAAPEQD